MQKAEMAKEIQKQVGLTTKREAVEALDSVLVLLNRSCSEARMSRSAGFGTFMVRSKRARRDRNPHTGQPVTITTYGLRRMLRTYRSV